MPKMAADLHRRTCSGIASTPSRQLRMSREGSELSSPIRIAVTSA
jgi:hypothetical protein